MGVIKYQSRGRTFWRVDEWLTQPSGQTVRFRQSKIPTREQALALAAKRKAEAFEGRHFDRVKRKAFSVAEAWALYEPVCKRDCDAWQTELARAVCFLRHLGSRQAADLTVDMVDTYRTTRLGEKTRTGGPPAPATLDREVELLKRCLNYAVRCKRLDENPIAGASLLREPNVRTMTVDEAGLAKLIEAARPPLRPILVVAFDTFMRLSEIVGLQWSQVDLKVGVIRLAPQDVKDEHHRAVYLTRRAKEALRDLPRSIGGTVFTNPATGEPWSDLRKMWNAARVAAGFPGLWFHDLRRSGITAARRAGIPESVIMRMSGHRTRSVFDRYNVLVEEDLQVAVRQLERAQEAHRVAITSEKTG